MESGLGVVQGWLRGGLGVVLGRCRPGLGVHVGPRRPVIVIKGQWCRDGVDVVWGRLSLIVEMV